MSYRPITDCWILARSKVKYYGAYPAGFLDRARSLLGISINDPLLHICGGKVKEYPFKGLGKNDKTIDINKNLNPDFNFDVRQLGKENGDIFPKLDGTVLNVQNNFNNEILWPACLIDRPYSFDDAKYYGTENILPDINNLLKRALSITKPGGYVGVLDYILPKPPKSAKFVACISVITGYNNRIRCYSVFRNET